ncbi:MAG: methyltetrahydrofolate cobalamin methyltransferase [Candidatus Abyssobacteria bacterium SURF_17]|jgi:5-methyltetrahydrofolate--homocysteine methyltransferase|uniref:Methyltetrahydrofolate cobalamin methyltransferase n=1 Tax=Candidatus Abyssobacteria bacterium SURF_17 TaxID=2093361 RepID=A0A419F5A7_9BACT|nr:MAG: methyltetrahydrofolate cobalamin methyltransferase [Candidatus Abyssubacteria bacterium SURF_17]
MLIIGERLNTSRKQAAEAAEKFAATFIKAEAEAQLQAGAHFLDVNAGTFAEREMEYLLWMAKTLRAEVDAPLCIDSSDPVVIREALRICGKGMMVNSISAEKDTYAAVLPLIKEHECKVVALCMGDGGIPTEFENKLEIGCELVETLLRDGIAADDIYIDPLIMAVSTAQDGGVVALRMIQEVRNRYPGVHAVCGLSNISFGLPERRLLNRIFLVAAMSAGLDAVILDPLDKQMMASLIAAKTVLGRDEYCSQYLAAFRAHKLEQ